MSNPNRLVRPKFPAVKTQSNPPASESCRSRHANWRKPVTLLAGRPDCTVGSMGGRNTLIFRKRWSVEHEVSSSHLLFGRAEG